MTGGTVVVLGAVGRQFRRRVHGWHAFVLDVDEMFTKRINPESIDLQRIAHPHWEGVLRGLIEAHVRETNSRYAAGLLHDWNGTLTRIWQVVPKGFAKYLPMPLSTQAAEKRA